MFQFQQLILLPKFEGFNRFVMWPSANDVGFSFQFIFQYLFIFLTPGLQGLQPALQDTSIAPDCTGVFLPFHPGFTYAAYPAEDSAVEVPVTVFTSLPDFLQGYTHVLDVSSRKVDYF